MTTRLPWIVVFSIAAACGRSSGLEQYPLRAEVAEFLRANRSFEARLSHDARFYPCPRKVVTSLRCDPQLSPSALVKASSLAARVGREVRRASGPDARWAAAVLDLVTAPPSLGALDRPVEDLDDLVAADSSNPRLLVDAAGAHLARHAQEQRADDLLRAITLAWRATRVDSLSAAAQFDLALALERLYLREEAGVAWLAAARLERADRAWAREARARHEALSSPNDSAGSQQLASAWKTGSLRDSLVARLAPDDAETLRVFALETLLPAWGESWLAKDSTRARLALSSATMVGEVLAGSTQDSVVFQAALAIAQFAGVSATAPALAVVRYREGQALYQRDEYARALPELEQAMHLLRVTGHPSFVRGIGTLLDWIGLSAGMIHLYGGRFRTADSLHQAIVERAEGQGTRALLGQAEWGLAISLARQSDLGGAMLNYRRAAMHLEQAGDRVAAGLVLTQLGALYQRAGFYNQALERALEGQRILGMHRNDRALGIGLQNLGYALEYMGETIPALMVQREAVRVAARAGQPADRTETLTRLAIIAGRVGLTGDAAQFADSAGRAVRAVGDTALRARMEAELATARGSLAASGETPAAIAALSNAIRYYQQEGLAVKLASPLELRGRLRLLQADTVLALADFQAAVRVLDEQARIEQDPSTRAALMAVQGSLYHNLVALYLRKGDTTLAAQSADKARPLLRRLLADTQRTSRTGSLTVAFTILPDRLIQWTRAGGQSAVYESRIPRSDLARSIADFERTIRFGSDSGDTVLLAEALYRIVLGPLERSLAGVRELIVVPDLELQRLPFALLRNPRTHRFLVEDLSVQVTSTPTAPPLQGPVGTLDGTMLLVDASGFDRGLFPEVPLLQFAQLELDGIRSGRKVGALATGAMATRDNLLRLIPRFRAVHYVGHARAIEARPELAHLITAASPGDLSANVLSATDILGMDLRNTALVVLSTCGTVPSAGSPLGGVGSLAQSFLMAGAKAVVNGIWEVDDRTTALLMQRFYVELERHAVPEALRQAQLWVLRNSHERGLASWGAFRVEG